MLRFLFALALPAILPPCSCMTGSPPCEAAWKASAVFLGTVAELTHERREPDASGSIQANGFLGTHATFEVAEALIGMAGRGKAGEAYGKVQIDMAIARSPSWGASSKSSTGSLTD